MENINERLYELYKSKKYYEYINLFLEYLNSGYSVTFDMIIHYLFVLVKLRKFDEVHNIIMNLKAFQKYDKKHYLARILYYCYKLDDSLELLKLYKNHLPKDDYLLAKIHMLKGNIDISKTIFEKILNDPSLDDITQKTIKKHLQKIYNNKNFNAFVEIEYQSFLEKGNLLCSGHVIYIKDKPLSINGHKENSDLKSNSRPYLVWKIENNLVYMFPVTKVCGKTPYHLFYQNYPNSEFDRNIKDNLCITTLDNIISVTDKLKDNDYSIIMSNIFVSIYNCPNIDEKEGRRKFLEE